MEQDLMAEVRVQVEDRDVEEVEAGWGEQAREQDQAEVASAPIATLGFHTK